jgi:impB/mucB/samB family
MNTSTADSAVQWLFLDLNAFFASCEQQENPALRGKPVIVVQTLTDSACAIAASYAAKGFGIKTGTLVRDARRLCPAVVPVQANHRLYTDYHDRILKAVDTCLPIEKVMSIDEVACRLMGTERQVPVARELALKIKRALREQVGECLTCSIGIAPNVFSAKSVPICESLTGSSSSQPTICPTSCSSSNCRRSTASARAWSRGFTAPASSPSPSSGKLRPCGCAGSGAASTACSSIRCCTVSIYSPPPPASPKASDTNTFWNRNCARVAAPGISRSTSSPRPPSVCGAAIITAGG